MESCMDNNKFEFWNDFREIYSVKCKINLYQKLVDFYLQYNKFVG